MPHRAIGGGGLLAFVMQTRMSPRGTCAFRLSKKWLAPLFRGVHSSLAPTARPGSYAGKPLLRKAFCGFDAHVAKSDQSLRGPQCGPQWSLRVAAKAASFKAPAHRASARLSGRAFGAREPWESRISGASRFSRQAAIARGVFLRAQKSPGKLTRAWDLVHPQGLEPWTP